MTTSKPAPVNAPRVTTDDLQFAAAPVGLIILAGVALIGALVPAAIAIVMASGGQL